MQWMLSVLHLASTIDMLFAVIIVMAYALALRVSDVCSLRLHCLSLGESERRADILITLDASKGDSGGEGFKVWLQHCDTCEFAYKAAPGNQHGRRWSPASAAGWQYDESSFVCRRCHACMLLMYLELSGALARMDEEETSIPEGDERDMPLFRTTTDGLTWSWSTPRADRRPVCASHFTGEALAYSAYGAMQLAVVTRVNRARAEAGLVEWSTDEAHFHMYRHGHMVMALLFGASPAELLRSAHLNEETLAVYAAHVSSHYAALLHTQEQGTEQSHASNRAAVEVLVARMVAAASEQLPAPLDAAHLIDDLLSWLAAVGVRLAGLLTLGAGLQQLLVYEAVVRRQWRADLAVPLLNCLSGSSCEDHRCPR